MVTHNSDWLQKFNTKLFNIAPTLKIREACQSASTVGIARDSPPVVLFDICSVVAAAPENIAATVDILTNLLEARFCASSAMGSDEAVSIGGKQEVLSYTTYLTLS